MFFLNGNGLLILLNNCLLLHRSQLGLLERIVLALGLLVGLRTLVSTTAHIPHHLFIDLVDVLFRGS